MRCWCLVEILKLMLNRFSVIWTQPSGPLCLWQCFIYFRANNYSWGMIHITLKRMNFEELFEQSTQKFSLAESKDLCSFIKTMTCSTISNFSVCDCSLKMKYIMLVWIALQAWEFLESYHSFNSHHLEIVEYPPQYNSTLCLQFFFSMISCHIYTIYIHLLQSMAWIAACVKNRCTFQTINFKR